MRGRTSLLFVAFAYPTFLQAAGEAAEGTLSVTPYNPFDARTSSEQFRQNYESKLERAPDSYAAQAYDAVQVIVKAFTAQLHELKRPPSALELREALRSTRYQGLTGLVSFDKSGELQGELTLVRACHGAFRTLGDPACSPPAEGALLTFAHLHPWGMLGLFLSLLLGYPRTARWLLSIEHPYIQTLALAIYTSPVGRWLLVRPYFKLLSANRQVARVRSQVLALPLRATDSATLPTTFEAGLIAQESCVIYGPSGSGKTTILSRLLQELADGLLPTEQIPFLVDGRSYDGDLIALVAKSVIGIDIKPQVVKALAHAGRLLLLVDGVSEIPQGQYDLFCADIAELTAFANNRLVLTTREQSREIPFLGLPGFTLGEVPEEQLDAYLGLHLSAPQARIELAADVRDGAIRGLPRTPLMLKMIAAVYSRLGRVPHEKTVIYEEYAAALLDRIPYERSGVRYVLRSVAETFFWQKGKREGFAESELIRHLGTLADVLKNWNVTAPAVQIVRALKQGGIVIESRGLLTFSHDSLEDLFCAQFLHEELLGCGPQDVLLHLHVSQFAETYHHLRALLKNNSLDRLRPVVDTLDAWHARTEQAAAPNPVNVRRPAARQFRQNLAIPPRLPWWRAAFNRARPRLSAMLAGTPGRFFASWAWLRARWTSTTR